MPILMRDRRQTAGGASTRLEEDMRNADVVMVQPVTTYMEGAEHKNERSEPYPVPRWHGEELKANGFARIVQEKPATKPVASSEPANTAADPTAEAPERLRGRRGSARG